AGDLAGAAAAARAPGLVHHRLRRGARDRPGGRPRDRLPAGRSRDHRREPAACRAAPPPRLGGHRAAPPRKPPAGAGGPRPPRPPPSPPLSDIALRLPVALLVPADA